MKKVGISAAFIGFYACTIGGAGAAYPMYQQQYAQQIPTQYQQQYAQQMPVQYQQQYSQQYSRDTSYARNVIQVPTVNNQLLTVNSGVAAAPTRITGALPQVGSAATTAGRRYYRPSDYDRLADSGLYVGFGVSYVANMIGSVSADYSGEKDSFTVPGAFAAANWDSDTVIPLQVSVGASLNNDFRVDFSYTRYSGIGYPGNVMTAVDDSYIADVTANVEGGAVTANTTMLNLYYNIDSYTGYLAGGSLRPYIGVGVGLSLNTISDYVVYDGSYYKIIEDLGTTINQAGLLTGISDIYAYHNGGTTEQLVFMAEAGMTTDLGEGIRIDFFARYANLGRVKTSGSIVLSQTEWLSDGYGNEVQADYDSVYHYTNWYESGRLGMIDIGMRLRLQF